MLLLTPGRNEAIANIRRAVAEGRFHDKTEPFDPEWDPKDLKAEILRYAERMDRPLAMAKKALARAIVDYWLRKYSDGVDEIVGMENIAGVDGPALLTCNHFNPFDTGILRTFTRQAGRGHLWAVSQGTNFVMPGLNGFVLRNIDVIPLIREPSYMGGRFRELMAGCFAAGRFLLIYPEQEMWFNYRKPRPGKRGAFLFSAEYKVPVIPCFIELQDLPGDLSPEFHDVRSVLHVLKPLYPDPSLSDRENSFRLCSLDYEAKVQAFEQAYDRPLTYAFSPWDIAGWKGK